MSAIPFKVEKSEKAWWFDRYYYHCIDCGAEFYHHKCDSRTNPYCCVCKRKHDNEKAKMRAKEREQKKVQEIRKKAIDEFVRHIVGYGTYDEYGNVVDILEIAEQLKGVRNE